MKDRFWLEFLVNIVIPLGFIVIDCKDIKTTITFEESDLATNIILDQLNCDKEGICTTIRNTAVVTGMLNYNVRFEGVRPAEPIDCILSSTTTNVSQQGIIQLNKMIAHSYNNDPVSTEFWIECKKGEEFITCIDGESVCRFKDSYDFMRILSNGNQSRTVSIPYRIKIHEGKVDDDK